MTTNDGGDAFPTLSVADGALQFSGHGMSLRDYFAAHVAGEFLRQCDDVDPGAIRRAMRDASVASPYALVAKRAFEIADAMIERRAAQDTEPGAADLIIHDLITAIRWLAQTVHQAHHEGDPAECPKNTCMAARDAIAKAGA